MRVYLVGLVGVVEEGGGAGEKGFSAMIDWCGLLSNRDQELRALFGISGEFSWFRSSLQSSSKLESVDGSVIIKIPE